MNTNYQYNEYPSEEKPKSNFLTILIVILLIIVLIGLILLITKKDEPEPQQNNEPIVTQKTNITLVNDNISIKVNETANLQYNIDGNNVNITFNSMNTDIATIDNNGQITGISPGTAVITLTYNNGTENITLYCNVNVIEDTTDTNNTNNNTNNTNNTNNNTGTTNNNNNNNNTTNNPGNSSNHGTSQTNTTTPSTEPPADYHDPKENCHWECHKEEKCKNICEEDCPAKVGCCTEVCEIDKCATLVEICD